MHVAPVAPGQRLGDELDVLKGIEQILGSTEDELAVPAPQRFEAIALNSKRT